METIFTTPVFVYHPRSSDRVFACWVEGIGLPTVITWQNGCRHVVGGTHLVYESAEPRAHWRYDAERMARRIIDMTGGIAWDDQGTIHLVVPSPAAWQVDRWMRAAKAASVGDAADVCEHDRNVAAMVITGAAPLEHISRGADGVVRASVRRVHDAWEVTVFDAVGRWRSVKAPQAWGPPVIAGPESVETEQPDKAGAEA
jgi:hypothetical protein